MTSKTRRIGSDQVVQRDDHLLVICAVEMEDWDVRQHRHTVIRFVERTWRVAGKTTVAGKTHYQLVPWTPSDQHLIGRTIDYNAEYVAQRDGAAVSTRKRSRVTFALRAVSPLIGFLPGRTKTRLEATYGVDPVATTFQSVFAEFIVALAGFAMTPVTFLLSPKLVAPFVIIAVVAGLDGAVRYDRLLKEERPGPGFYEWVRRRRPRG